MHSQHPWCGCERPDKLNRPSSRLVDFAEQSAKKRSALQPLTRHALFSSALSATCYDHDIQQDEKG